MKCSPPLRLVAALLLAVIMPHPVRSADPLFPLVNAFPNLELKDCVATFTVIPGKERWEIAGLQRGLVLVLPKDRQSADAQTFLDLRDRLKDEVDFEEGLHGIVFHPEFHKNRRFFVSYTQRAPRRTVISEMCVLPGKDLKADLRSERLLLELPHPMGAHWGGTLAFGPDGFLYVGIGDGGLRDDPYRLAQSPWSLQGKILRLDPDSRSGALPYGIPEDNPFLAKDAIRDEIWALGFRNPWGLSFDEVTGRLWVADVGQDIWEEVNVVERGGNYGWSEREGPHRFSGRADEPEKGGPFIDPVHAYPHSEGISITGGMVYRGGKLPALHGQYVFGDWGHGKLWALSHAPPPGQKTGVRLIFAREGEEPRFNPTTIGPDAQGEVLIASHHPPTIYTLRSLPILAEESTDSPEPAPLPVPDSLAEPAPTEGEENSES